MKRNILNIWMIVLFLLLMNYRFTGNVFHEILGVVLLLLVLWHNELNLSWYMIFFKGRQSIQRILGTLVNFFFIAALLVSMFSGLLISESLVPFIALRGTNTLWLHELHQSSSYVCFILIGVHVGLHWEMLWIRLKRWLGLTRFYKECAIFGNVFGVGIIVYGIYASFSNHIASMLLMEHGFGWGKAPSTIQFFVDYLAIFGCYTSLTYYVTSVLQKVKYSRKD